MDRETGNWGLLVDWAMESVARHEMRSSRPEGRWVEV